MRVLLVSERSYPAVGGVETHVGHLSKELRRLGQHVQVLSTDLATTSPLRRFSPIKESDVIRVRAYEALPLRQGLGIISPGMVNHLNNFDIVHAHGYGHFPAYLTRLCNMKGVPIVITTHSDEGRSTFRKKVFDAINPLLSIKAADGIIAVSEHERTVISRLGIKISKIKVIPNGIDLEEIDNFLRTNPVKSELGGLKIIYAGRVDLDQKGVDVLLRAFQLVHNQRKDTCLEIIGPDWNGSKKKLSELATSLGISESIRFTGFLDRQSFLSRISSADVFVLPSRFEPFGIVLLEVMALGVPIVASRVGGVPEIVKDGIAGGVLFDSENHRQLAKEILRLLNDKEYAFHLAQKARLEIVPKFCWDKIAADTLNFYRILVQEKQAKQ